MPDESLIHHNRTRVHSYDADAGGHLSLAALARHLQDAAADSAEALGFGFSAMRARSHAWVLQGLRLQIARRPAYDETITVTTWPRELIRLHAMREFVVTDVRDREIARASSTWLMIDVNTRRPVRPDHYFDRPWHPQRALDRDPGPVAALTSAEAEAAIAVRWGDLDVNGHLNNTHYLDLILETFDDAWLLAHDVREVEMAFLAEGRRGDVITSRRQPSDGGFLHSLVRQRDGKEIFRARTDWT